jgi:quercetin dioxygenase-like cupin family protein
MFVKCEDGIYYEVAKGVSCKNKVHGEKMLQCEIFFEKEADVPVHELHQDLTAYLVSGFLQLSINEKSYRAEPGDSWYVPKMVKHSTLALEDSMVIEVYSPKRADYLD